MINLKIKEISENNRPREKLKKKGAEYLSDEELIAILLRCGNKEYSALELAYIILNKAGNLKRLFQMNYKELIKISGIKDSKASTILASIELAKRALSYSNEGVIYDKPEYVFDLIKPLIGLEKTEVFYAIYLDSCCHLIEYKKLSIGNFRSVSIPKQKIYQDALRLSVTSVVICHNHPSGDPTPSNNDIAATLEIKDALELIGVILLDHIIIANNSYYSFNEKNKL